MKERCRRAGIVLTVLLAMIMTLFLGSASADLFRPSGLRTQMPVKQGYTRKRSTEFTGVENGLTGIAYTYTAQPESNVATYQFVVGIVEGSIADAQYQSARSASNELNYTFYEPGTYTLYCYRYDTYGNMITWISDGAEENYLYKEIEIRDSGKGNALTQAVQDAASECQRVSEFETAVKINDWLAELVTYEPNWDVPTAEVYYSPQGALLNSTEGGLIFRNTCVCNGYCRAYQLVAQACGLKCGRVSGGGHAWNVVRINGYWYHVDPTWNDTTGLTHLYLGMNDTLITREHTIKKYPNGEVVCNSLDANYFVATGKFTNLAYGVRDEIQRQINADNTVEVIFGDRAYVEEEGSFISGQGETMSNMLFYNGNIVAYGYSLARLTRTTDNGKEISMTGEFSYDEQTNKISGTLHIVAPDFDGFLIPAGTIVIEQGAFYATAAEYVRIPEECTTIGDEAFRNSELKAIYLPVSVSGFGTDPFPDDTVIYTPSGSPAEEWADVNGYEVIPYSMED